MAELVGRRRELGALDAALDAAYRTAAIYYPFEDLLAANPYTALTDGAILAFYIGPSGIVAGTKTEMLAWATAEETIPAHVLWLSGVHT